EGKEIKLKMVQGAKAQYAWVVEGGEVNFDTHGDAPGKSISYEKGRGVSSDAGVLEAAFTGNHGWYWRNRGKSNVKVILRTRGDYTEIKQMM
ncbi:MAG: transmembrane anchor protein, partial [Burkholderiales bacterium]|nr:transmembrane anchor protein [Burkholderiales bacterium]